MSPSTSMKLGAPSSAAAAASTSFTVACSPADSPRKSGAASGQSENASASSGSASHFSYAPEGNVSRPTTASGVMRLLLREATPLSARGREHSGVYEETRAPSMGDTTMAHGWRAGDAQPRSSG